MKALSLCCEMLAYLFRYGEGLIDARSDGRPAKIIAGQPQAGKSRGKFCDRSQTAAVTKMELSAVSYEESRPERSFPVTSVGVARTKERVKTDSAPRLLSRRTSKEPSFWRETAVTHVAVSSAGPSLFASARTSVSLPSRKDCSEGCSRGPFLDFARRSMPRTMLPAAFSAS